MAKHLASKAVGTVLGMALCASLLALLPGCGDTGTVKTADGVREVLLGADLESSGKQGSWGMDSRHGIELAVDEINADAKRKLKMRVIFEDNKSLPGQSKDAMKKLCTQDNVLAVIGAVSSNLTIPAADVAMDEKVPLMTHASTNVSITKRGEYVSRICYTDDFQGGVMARFARRTLKAETAVMMLANGNAYSEGLCESFKKTFTAEGGKILDVLAYPADTQNFKTHITTLKQLNPAVVWLPGYFNEVSLIVKQARDEGFQAPFLGADGWDDPLLFKQAGPAIKGNYFSNHFFNEDPNPKVQNFVKVFKARYNEAPGAMAALAYDAAYAMADAASRAKTLTPEGMKDAINTIKGVEGVCGTINMGPDREVVKDVVVLETGETAYKFKETIKP